MSDSSSAANEETMYALQTVALGKAKDSLKYVQVPKPKLSPSQPTDVLIQVKAAGINPVEAKFRMGNVPSLLVKLPSIFGTDYAGIVVAKGDKVTDLEVGDAVYGSLFTPWGPNGTYAEYIIAKSGYDSIVKKPDNISFEEAAATGIAATTAYQGIIVDGRLPETGCKKILVIGASGGVGTYGVQIAKAIGAEVVAICSGKNADFVQSLGADRIVDYTVEGSLDKLEKEEKETYDLILDCIGGEDYYNKLVYTLKKQGVYSSAVGPEMHVGANKVSMLSGASMTFKTISHKVFGPRRYSLVLKYPWIRFAKDLRPFLANGSVKSIVREENIVVLKDGVEAHLKIESHRTVGKIVLRV
ncbi:chaperonin 10-like protein [Zychaea mexicana]|uniref:chaperonin 10-like protein n=1 Tax=Zychaea mexicana TaxID=64656 RepID=UPI0022FEDCEC|nr:chaperonin 10-like protein [Zychaea mexicana]KAI9496864.1 chaperonin 10-like protein [Zychaea mexicana]